jgi:hypothetical protein
MEKLIRKIIKEFVNSKVSFKVIGNVGNLINEDINSVDLNIANEVISRKLKRINPFQGSFIDKKTGKNRVVNFIISASPHFIERKFRLSEPEYQKGGKLYDPKIVEPDYLEGINLIYENRDKIAERILNGTIKDGDLVKVTSADGSNYHMIVKFNSHYSDMENFEIILITQIKGVDLLSRRFNNKLNLYPKK